MNCQEDAKNSQQFLLYRSSNSEPSNKIEHRRRSANYKPNAWKHDFLESLTPTYKDERHEQRFQKLIENAKTFLVNTTEKLEKLELTDNIGKLGLASLFPKEIKNVLSSISCRGNSNLISEENLYSASLEFRLLRLHGYEVSQDMLPYFLDKKGDLTESCKTNVKGMLELLEASELALQGEITLQEAKEFCTRTLKRKFSSLDEDLASRVLHTLELSLHWRVQWYNVPWQIKAYEKEKMMNCVLLELAKLNFNMVQMAHQKDILEMSRWWRNLGLMENLEFARDRLVESYLCAMGLAFEPEQRMFRRWLTKAILMILVLDDTYDLYGSVEELSHFTNVVDRWEQKEIEQLPHCIRICFQALDQITNETVEEIRIEKGWTSTLVLPCLRKVWAGFCGALFKEAQWDNERETPSLKDYLDNAWISSSGPVILQHALLSPTAVDLQELDKVWEKHQDLVYHSSLIIRLCNDLGTYKAERERGDVPSSILCYMREAKVSEEIAQMHVKGLITEAWKKLNEASFSMSKSPLEQYFVNMATNAARVAHFLYRDRDGFGGHSKGIRDEIRSLLFEAMI